MAIKAVYRYIDKEHRDMFNQSQCLLTVSVGQEVHEEEKFEQTIELVNHTFKSCILLVDDSLQRHTMVLDKTESAEDVYAFSVLEGDRWLERNAKYYNKLTNLSQILRWDHWLNHPEYGPRQEELKQLLGTDPSYMQIFDASIQEFLRRYYARLISQDTFDKARAYQLCFDYLLEECTAMTLWPELGCHYEVYPSKRNEAMAETHRRFVLPLYPSSLHAVAIKFKNRKQLKPQQFALA